ncbi:MAG: LacI family DNA-binding transcriptional regulator [Acholeplasma sp.]|nr:LacI family DNA-binding transcriptional regulator [Acholeplasma sp.]
MKEKVSIQQIADELGLSRNTVSKVINNKPVPGNTRERVIQKAIELGYKGFSQYEGHKVKKLKLLLLAGKPLSNLDFFISMMRGVENLVTNLNIDFFQYTLNSNTSLSQLHSYMENLKIDGIIGIELYDEVFLKRFLELKTPIIFIDAAFGLKDMEGNFDAILMESRDSMYQITKAFIQSGLNRIVFCGDYKHCQGFYERFLGVRDAISDIPHRMDLSQQLILPDDSPFGDASWLAKKINHLQMLPQAIICANDSIAINVCQAIKKMGLSIPKEIQVVGFDNIVDTSIYKPSITTVNVNKELLGQEALYMLIDRINRPSTPTRMIYFKTEIIYRQSTTLKAS